MLNPFGPVHLVLATTHPAATPDLGVVTDSLRPENLPEKSGPRPVVMHTSVLDPGLLVTRHLKSRMHPIARNP